MKSTEPRYQGLKSLEFNNGDVILFDAELSRDGVTLRYKKQKQRVGISFWSPAALVGFSKHII